MIIRNEVVKIGYLSFDASVKIHYSGKYTSTKTSKSGNMGIAGYIRHIDRSTDKMNGCEVQHSNPDINSDLTLENESYYKDSNGEWQRTSRSKDMENAINRRIEYAKEHGARISTKGKNDTVIVRPLVLQMGNDSITGHENTWMWDLIGILEEEFGTDNITGFSIHKDETNPQNPHIHISFVPCHETEKNGKLKCSISQTKFFHNPKQLAGLHRKFRKKLLDKGYDIELENKPIEEQLAGYYDKNGEWHQQGLTPDQLKELTDRELNLRMEMVKMKYKQSELDMLEKALSNMMKSTKAKQEEMEKEHEKELENLHLQQTALDNEKVRSQAAVLLREMNAKKREMETEEMFENICATAEICSRILKEKNELNPDFLEYLGKEGEKRGKPFRRFVEIWHKNFLDEYSEKISEDDSDLQMELKHCVNKLLKQKNEETRSFPDTSDIKRTGCEFLF